MFNYQFDESKYRRFYYRINRVDRVNTSTKIYRHEQNYRVRLRIRY